MSKKKKYKVNKLRLTAAILVALLLIAGIGVIAIRRNNLKTVEPETASGFLGSDGGEIALYTAEITEERNLLGKITKRDVVFSEGGSSVRGNSAVRVEAPEKDEEGNVIYEQILMDGQTFYVKPGSFVTDYNDVVMEKTKYVQISSTVYVNETDAKIAGFIRKGSEVEIKGFDKLRADGSVEMYKISGGGAEGWVFAKYLVDTQEEADFIYDKEVHEDAVYSYELYGGDPLSASYFPMEKPNFPDNPINTDVRAMYIGVGCSSIIDSYISVALENGVNAMCIDIQDDILGFESEAAKELSPTTYANTYYDAEHYGEMIQKVKDAGIYVIGRIVCFNDDFYAADHPENCIDYYGTNWPSVYSRDMWYYKVSVALEAIDKFGFNEIQFDYVRFPESSYGMSKSGVADFRNKYNETKVEAVQNFLIYAADMIHRKGVYVEADVFGECSNGYVTAYGQYWPAISNVVDVISAMPYVDHFENNPVLWRQPYNTMYNWGRSAARSQEKTATPAIARTWVTAYSVPYWNPEIYYSASEIAAQAQGLWDAGLTGGFLTWNVANDIYRYSNISWAWSKNYGN